MAHSHQPSATSNPSDDDHSAALPAFLDTDPFPSASRDGTRPTSAATDITSEFGGEDFTSARERHSNIPSTTGPVGEPGLPPSRPSSVGTSVVSGQTQRTQRLSMQPPSSRRGLQALAVGRSGSAKGGGGSQAGDSDAASRPNSSLSKTHVPSLTSQGFFRPMSGQKLQAQRNQRPASSLGQNVTSANRRSEDVQPRTSQHQQRPHRYSNASVNTLRDGPPPTRDEDAPPLPVSRGTVFTNDGEGQTDAGGTTAASVISKNSNTPLNSKPAPVNTKLDTSRLRMSNTPSAERIPKSPRSLRASLGLGSRASKQDRPSPGREHEKLESNPSSPQDAEKPLPIPPSDKPPLGQGKNYEYFAGNMLFFLSGRCMNTKAKPLNVVTFVLTILPAALFFAFSAPWLWHHVSPAIPIIFAYVFYIAISAFLHAALSDPGILPRNMHPHPPNPDEDRDPLTPGPPTTEWIMVKTFPSAHKSPLPSSRSTNAESGENGTPNTTTQAMEVPTKYCKSCAIWRPPRAHHCRVCDACIETQDHHCVWLNNCVGRRNYRYFFAYVCWGSILALLLLAFSLTHVGLYAQHHSISFAASLTGRTQERVAFAMFLYAIFALPYPGSLFVYHLFLLGRGETTREYLNSHKFPAKDRHRPFAQASMVRNWISVLVRPRPPGYMQFKRRYRQGDVRLGYDVPKKQRRERQREMKGRYSVQGPSATKGQQKREKEGHEMKELPPLPPPSSHGQKREGVTAGGAGVVTEPINRTPR